MKYIIFESNLLGVFPIVFPQHLDHSLVANGVCQTHPGIKATSAGFAHFVPVVHDSWQVVVSGESATLNLKPQPSDENLLTLLLVRSS